MPDYSNPFQAYQAYKYDPHPFLTYTNEQYGINPNSFQNNIWNAYNNQKNNNNNNNPDDDGDLWKLFGKNFAKGLLSDPIGGVASIWNTYNAWRNDKAELNMKKEYFNMHKDAYLNNERRTEQAFQEHRANRYGNML